MSTTETRSPVTPEEMAPLATRVGRDPREWLAAFEALNAREAHEGPVTATAGPPSKVSRCVTRNFSIGIVDGIDIEGSLEVCASSPSDWTARLTASLDVAGSSVWQTTYQFSAQSTSITYTVDALLAKAHLTFAVHYSDRQVCLEISGDVEYWVPPFSWDEKSFDETVFCLPLSS